MAWSTSTACYVFVTAVLIITVPTSAQSPTPYTEVEVCDTEREVTLPCPYIGCGENDEVVKIEWYFRGFETVMSVAPNGTVSVGGNFTDRVSRGGGANLILHQTRKNDSGIYECEVFTNNSDSCCYKNLVNLTNECKDKTLSKIVCILDSASIISTLIVVPVLWYKRSDILCYGLAPLWLIFGYVPALALCTLSVSLLATYLGSSDYEVNKIPGICIGIVGICVVTAANVTWIYKCLKPRSQEVTDHSDDREAPEPLEQRDPLLTRTEEELRTIEFAGGEVASQTKDQSRHVALSNDVPDGSITTENAEERESINPGQLNVTQSLLGNIIIEKEEVTDGNRGTIERDQPLLLETDSTDGYLLDITDSNISDISAEEDTELDVTDLLGRTSLNRSALEGCPDDVRDHGADTNVTDNDGRTYLHLSAIGGYLDTVKCLLTQGDDINRGDNSGLTALHLAAAKGHTKIVRHLVIKGCDKNVTDKEGRSSLHLATFKGHVEVVRCLITQGADINIRDNKDLTSLHLASGGESTGTLRYLLATAGVDVNATYHGGRTCLHRAALYGRIDNVRLLVDEGAKVNCADRDGRVPLHMAASEGHSEIVRYLIVAGADKRCADNIGLTCLHLAAGRGHQESVRYLASEAKVDLDAVDNEGWTCLDWAVSKGYTSIERYLGICAAKCNVVHRNNLG